MTIEAGAIITADDFVDELEDLDTRVTALESSNPKCRVTKTGSQTINDITGTPLTWDVESWDIGPIHSGSSSQLIAPMDGIYEGMFYAVWETDTGGYRKIEVRANGSTVVAGTMVDGDGSEPTQQTVAYEIFLSAGDYVEGVVYFDASGSPATLDVVGASMTMRYVGTTT